MITIAANSEMTTEDRVILNPSDSLADGTRVEAKPQAEANAPAQK
jgi:hypothetical protein